MARGVTRMSHNTHTHRERERERERSFDSWSHSTASVLNDLTHSFIHGSVRPSVRSSFTDLISRTLLLFPHHSLGLHHLNNIRPHSHRSPLPPHSTIAVGRPTSKHRWKSRFHEFYQAIVDCRHIVSLRTETSTGFHVSTLSYIA